MADMDGADEERLLMVLLYNRHKRRRRKQRIWVRKILQRRKELGEFHRLVRELTSHEDRLFQYFRMSEIQFLQLYIKKQQTNYREPISVKERLAICLRFLATGESYKRISFSYRVGKSTVVNIVPEVCDALWNKLQPLYIPVVNEGDWARVADGFQQKWQFPNCIGAIDGKHIHIQAPPNSGSLFFNYKRTFSIVLIALVDHMYCFIFIDVGAYGCNSDGGIFANSQLGRALEGKRLRLPSDKPLSGAADLGNIPHVIVGDEAFPMKTNLMRPYPGNDLDDSKRIFSYRLSRARRIVENAFGILTSRWKIYQRRMQLHPHNIDKVVKATCALHNFIQKTSPSPHAGDIHIDCNVSTCSNGGGSMTGLGMRRYRAGQETITVREAFRSYFNSPAGMVSWQRKTFFGQAN